MVDRILFRWNALIEYFETNTDDKDVAKYIWKKLNKPYMKIYFQFLRVFLEDINQLNKQFQEKSSQIFKINEVIVDYYNLLINLILKP